MSVSGIERLVKNMKSRFVKNIISGICALTLAVSILPGCNKVTAGVVENKIEYHFASQNPGLAYGEITVSTEKPGDYQLYWGDESGNKLKYNGVSFTELADVETTESKLTTTYKIPSEYTVIPQGAEKLMLVDSKSTTVYTYDIPKEKQLNEGNVIYQFGLMSDVHYNRYHDFSEDDSVVAFNNALKFVNAQGIDFLGMTGDLSSHGEKEAFTKFKTAIDKYPKMTVYTCMGNHDVGGIKDFNKYVNTKKTTDKNIKNINSNGVDFVYEKQGDIFIFFSQTKWSYNGKFSRLLEDQQLNWLEKNLNTFANKHVYLFFHSYFALENGDVTNAVGNLKNPGGYTYDLTYTFGNDDEKRFRKLLNKYANVTMFNGHSHWAYDQQKYNSDLNIGNINSKKTGASIVHLASVSAPRTIETNSTERDENNGKLSQGTVALRYKNSTVYLSTDFIEGKYMADASYICYDGKKGTPIPEVRTGGSKIKSIGKIKKVSRKSNKYKVLVKYKKVKNAFKYEIQYATHKKFKAGKTKTKRTNKTKYTITKLKNRTTYYIRVRAYRYQFGERVYGKWSKVKRLKIKKK